MTSEQIREALHTQPFRPFFVHTADGASFEVRHPEMALHTESGRTIFVNTGGDNVEIIDIRLVTRLSYTNGHKPRKQRTRRKGAS